ncbi:MAG: endonuclease III domain-containing protein [Armatimonadota bacterium]
MPEQAKQVTPEEIECVAELLVRAYPYIRQHKTAEGVLTDSPLESLVRAVLSQNTTDVNRDRAYNALRLQYPSWDQVADAPTEEVAEAIRQTNYAFTKAGRIQQILRELRDEYGAPTLDFLREWPTDRILTYLKHFPGVGSKSAAIVALFTLGRPVMPVDVHVHRVTGRLGWIGEKTSPERAHVILQRLIPEDLIFTVHVGMWEHGHTTCRPVPKCRQCAVYRFCLYPAKTAPIPPVEEAIAITAGRKAA